MTTHDDEMLAIEAAVGSAILDWSRLDMMLKLQTFTLLAVAGHDSTEMLELLKYDTVDDLVDRQKEARKRLPRLADDSEDLVALRVWWQAMTQASAERDELVHGYYALRKTDGAWRPCRATFRVRKGAFEGSMYLLSPEFLAPFTASRGRCWDAWMALPAWLQTVPDLWSEKFKDPEVL